ncbi:Membrane protein implicated in regulation of membrane protease activity [Collimonas sp. OK242]|jgi:membrane protein implicated in regulation of membrane protease activity|uniref:NfeD family protein n=1 Tax=Collimonas sp. OK242 TaxID=1798195 RepID=UPI00089A9883|nr:NfeD family protein [Collimonas sp. OK242]SDX37384.1 Membrane protein implicated in regulation of membrane protease activity [Collimonas sp. OK242]
MAGWVMWMLAAGVLVVAELFTTTLYLLMVAIGLAVGGVVALTGLGVEWQLLAAAVVALAATYVLRRSKFGRRTRVKAERDPNVNLDIGQPITVEHWQHDASANGAGGYTARVKYRGAMWDVELAPAAHASAGQFFIHEIRGSRLIVSNSPDHH